MKFIKKNIKIIFYLFIVAGFMSVCYKMVDYYSFSEEKVVERKSKYSRDTLRIIFIGDSWAAYHSKYDSKLKSILETKLKTPVTVNSKGSVGAKTKAIYVNMYDSSLKGTKKLIDLCPDYAVISAGINDAVAKMGTKNYCHHYNLIIKNLLSAGIKPIILDMPQVDYRAIYQRESILKKMRHQLSSLLTNAPLWDFEEYRNELISMIYREKSRNNFIYIPSSDWNPKGYADPRQIYLEDHIHLNEKGYLLLDSCIASYILSDIQPIHGFQ